jgi:hypothetical protein
MTPRRWTMRRNSGSRTMVALLAALFFLSPAISPAPALSSTEASRAALLVPGTEASQSGQHTRPEQAVAQQRYTIADLGSFTPVAINNKRQIVGTGQCSYLWENGVLTCISDPDGLILSARDINEQGQVLFAASNLGPQYLWTDANKNKSIDAGEKQALPALPGYERATVWSVNDLGTVVGWSNTIFDDGSAEGNAVAWMNGVPTGLGGFSAYDINNAGIVVGPEDGGNKGVRWVNGMLNPLPSDFIPVAINDRGEIVGYATAQFTLRQHLWLPAPAYGRPAGLHDLGFVWYAGANLAADINEHGQVIGGSRYVWQNGELIDVNTLLPPDSGWSQLAVEAINDHGDIVGRGRFNGQQRGYLLSELPRWTLLFYLAGDNNLSNSYGAIVQHLETMANLPGVRIFVLWDTLGPSGSWYYEVQYDADLSKFATYTEGVNLWSQGELNMGAPFTLSDFIQWGSERSPSQHYALILDDHGNGLGGLAWDDTSNRDFITLPELKLALGTAQDQTTRRIDVLYMAMCLMGMIEDAYQVRGLADYYVASEDLQTTYSRYLTGFDPAMTPAQFAAALADAYAQEMVARSKAYTISAADLAQLDPLVNATNGLGQALAARMEVISGTLGTVANLVQRFDSEAPRTITLADTYVDLYDFADLVERNLGGEATIVAQAAAAKQAVQNYILYEAHASSAAKKLDNSHGVSIFFPATASSFYNPDNYAFAVGADWSAGQARPADSSKATTWGSFLVDYFQATQPGGQDDPTPPLPLPKEYETFALHLPLVRR